MDEKFVWIILLAILVIGLMAIGTVVLLLSGRRRDEEEPDIVVPQWEVELLNVVFGFQVAFHFSGVCVLGRLTLCQNAIGTIPPLMDRTVSREHCMLVEQGGVLLAWNMSAINPTKINGYPINEPAQLFPGDRIELGDSVFVVTKINYEANYGE